MNQRVKNPQAAKTADNAIQRAKDQTASRIQRNAQPPSFTRRIKDIFDLYSRLPFPKDANNQNPFLTVTQLNSQEVEVSQSILALITQAQNNFTVLNSSNPHSSSGKGMLRSSNLEIPEVKAKLGKDSLKFQSSDNDGFVVPMHKSTTPDLGNSSSMNIPETRGMKQTTRELQSQLMAGEGILSIEYYENFQKSNWMSGGKVSAQSVCKPFVFLIFQLLYKSGQNDKLICIKDDIFRLDLKEEILDSKWEGLHRYGSKDTSQKQVKRIFLEYFIRVFQDESSVDLIEKYSILEDILEMAVTRYSMDKLGAQKSTHLEQSLRNPTPGSVYPLLAEAFALKLDTTGSRFTFISGDSYLQIIANGETYTGQIK